MCVPEYGDGRNALSRIATDWFFYCPSRRAAMALSVSATTYLYPLLLSLFLIRSDIENRYEFLYSPIQDPFNPASYCKGNACHGSEIVFVFHSAGFLNGGHFYNSSEVTLSWSI